MITCTGGGFPPPFLTTITGHAILFYRIHDILAGAIFVVIVIKRCFKIIVHR